MTVYSGTGSRSLRVASDEHRLAVREFLITDLSARDDIEYVISGMAEGFDELLARVAIDLGIPVLPAIPNPGYADYYWGKHSLLQYDRRGEFNWYLHHAGMDPVYVCESIYVNGVHANFIRNTWMVQRADFFYVYDPHSAGTKHCFAELQEAGKNHLLVPLQRPR